MENITNYFLDHRKKRHYYVKFKNGGKKPVIFSSLIHDFNFDEFKRDYTYELLKTEVICDRPLELFRYLIKNKTEYSSIHNLWCLKKRSLQYMGISFSKFLSMIHSKKNFIFNYPLIHDHYYLILHGFSSQPKTYKLFLYVNNRVFSYIDIINFFKEDVAPIDSKVEIKKIKKLRAPEMHICDLKDNIPQLKCTSGYMVGDDYCEFYYFIKRPRIKKSSFMNGLSHLLVWSNETPMKYKEKKLFSFYHQEILYLDELVILTIKTSMSYKGEDDSIIKS